MQTFISYSHKDYKTLDQLHTHLAVLLRDGRIDAWVDRDVLAGEEINLGIEEQLEQCMLFLLLVSPDFLASDYCIEQEMKRALERHHAGDAIVVPIIIEPCDWKSTQLGDLKALPKDGIPISEWPNKNNAFLNVVQELRRVLAAYDEDHANVQVNLSANPETARPGGRRYLVKRDFDVIDISDFRQAAYAEIRTYFERAISEIDAIEDIRGRFSSITDASFTCTIVNRARVHGTAHITIHRRMEVIDIGDIYYSFTENSPRGTANGIFTIHADEYDLFLKSLMMNFGHDEKLFTPEAAAEQLWMLFLQNAGVACD